MRLIALMRPLRASRRAWSVALRVMITVITALGIGFGGGLRSRAQGGPTGTPAATPPVISVEQVAGRYGVSRVAADGTLTQGTLKLTLDGPAWRVEWASSEVLGTGIAILNGDQLVVGVGLTGCQVFSYTVAPDTTLSGRWAALITPIISSGAAPILNPIALGDDNARPNPATRRSTAQANQTPPAGPDLAGAYTTSGHAPGSDVLYLGTQQIVRRTAAAGDPYYQVTRTVGSTAAQGLGVSVGPDADKFAAIVATTPRLACTLAVFTFLDSETLEGSLVTLGGAEVASMSAARLR